MEQPRNNKSRRDSRHPALSLSLSLSLFISVPSTEFSMRRRRGIKRAKKRAEIPKKFGLTWSQPTPDSAADLSRSIQRVRKKETNELFIECEPAA